MANNICRLCRKSDLSFPESIFSTRSGLAITEIIMKVCPIPEICVDDGLPSVICDECLEILLSSYELQVISKESDIFFRYQMMKGAFIVKQEDLETTKAEDKSEDERHFEFEHEAESNSDDPSYDDGLEAPTITARTSTSKEYESTPRTRIHDKVHNNDVNKSQHHKKRTRTVDVFHPRPLPGQSSLKYDDIRYRCNFCEKVLKIRKHIMNHIRLKHNPAVLPLGCRFCTERFKRSQDLESHEKQLHDGAVPTILFCDFCAVSGSSRDGMSNHIIDDHLKCSPTVALSEVIPDSSSQCQKCRQEFSDKFLLRNHILMDHDKMYRIMEPHEVTQAISCCACNEQFDTEKQILKHAIVHKEGFSSVKCAHSRRPHASFLIFYNHIKHQSKPKTHQCLKCNKTFPFDSKFITHLTFHQKMYHRKLQCEKCKTFFKNQRSLDIHDKVKHRQETLFMCPFCAKSLGSETILTNHIKYVHNAEDEKKFECKICAMKFINISKLRRHETTHSTDRPNVCELCGAGFKHKDGLVVHMKRHNGTLNKKFQCNQCSVKFTTQHRLAQHTLTHSGAKPHECTFCDRAYASKGDLVKHLQKVHVGHAVYRCEKCPEAFPRIVELREHLKSHVEDC